MAAFECQAHALLTRPEKAAVVSCRPAKDEEVTVSRIRRLLGQWCRREARDMAREARTQGRQARADIRAARQAAEAERQAAEKRQRELRKARWQQMNRRDITMAEILGREHRQADS